MFRSFIVISTSFAFISCSLIWLWIFGKIAFIPASSARYAHFLLNLILLESAIIVAVCAVLIEVTLWQHNIMNQVQIIRSLHLITFVICGIVILVSLFGCYGLIQRSRCCLILYSFLLFVVAAVEIAIGVYAFLETKAIATNLLEEMNQKLSEYNKDAVTKNWWDNLQHDFQCCGVLQAVDWRPYVTKEHGLPTSCCVDSPMKNRSSSCASFKANKIGCFWNFTSSINFRTRSSAIITIVFGILQIICSIVSYSLELALFRKGCNTIQQPVELNKVTIETM